jgi:hypothetical protein
MRYDAGYGRPFGGHFQGRGFPHEHMRYDRDFGARGFGGGTFRTGGGYAGRQGFGGYDYDAGYRTWGGTAREQERGGRYLLRGYDRGFGGGYDRDLDRSQATSGFVRGGGYEGGVSMYDRDFLGRPYRMEEPEQLYTGRPGEPTRHSPREGWAIAEYDAGHGNLGWQGGYDRGYRTGAARGYDRGFGYGRDFRIRRGW